MIAFDCPGCTKRFSVKDEFGGRTTKCPKCGASIRVPAPVNVPATHAEAIPQAFPDTTEREAEPASVRPQLMACSACGNHIAMTATACPKCGAPNNWLHPEIQRFANSLQSVNFLPAQSNVFWKGFRVWGSGFKKNPKQDTHPMNWGPKLMIVAILVGIFGGFVNVALLAIAPIMFFIGLVGMLIGSLSDTVPIDLQVAFELDFSSSPPKWTCNDEEYWAEVRSFFNV